MNQVVKIAKIGKSTNSTNPNDFIFHSTYNTFKIIKEDTFVVSLSATTANQTFSIAHGYNSFLPLISAFAKQQGSSQVFLPNGIDVETFGSKAGLLGDVTFNYVSSDKTNINFNFDNDSTAVQVSIRYFILEAV